MDNDKATIVFQMIRRNISVDLEIPLDITAMELVIGLDNAYELGVDVTIIHPLSPLFSKIYHTTCSYPILL